MIKVVFVDIDNTLIDFDRCAVSSMQRACRLRGVPHSDEMIEVFNRINDSLWQKIERGELTKQELHRIRWQLIFDKMHIASEGLAFEREFIDGLSMYAHHVEGAMELLKYLRSKYKVCAASNGPYVQQTKRLAIAGMDKYMDEVFVSEHIGADKPSKAFFDACFAHLSGVEPSEAIIIGDSVTADIVGGSAYGLITCHYDHRRTGDTGMADYYVTHLRDLLRIL